MIERVHQRRTSKATQCVAFLVSPTARQIFPARWYDQLSRDNCALGVRLNSASKVHHVRGSAARDLHQRILHRAAGAAFDHHHFGHLIFFRHPGECLFGSDPSGVCLAVSGQRLQIEHGQQAERPQLWNHLPPLVDGANSCTAATDCYSITSSALASRVGGTLSASALAVLRLITSSNLVGSCTGKSAGFSPLRMRSA
jgi:hypothetical protein